METVEEFRGSQLLDFLEALPMLRAVRMKITAEISLEGIPRERVWMVTRNGSSGYKLAARSHLRERIHLDDSLEEFPTSTLLNVSTVLNPLSSG